jgi:glycerol-3-phosphate dehydrogenase
VVRQCRRGGGVGFARDEVRTDAIPLPGAPEGDLVDFKFRVTERLQAAGLSEQTIQRLVWLYGRQLHQLLALAESDPGWMEPLGPGVPAVRGEVKLAVECEMASKLIDFMDRRSVLLLFPPDFGLAGAVEAAEIMGSLLGWDEARKAAELEGYQMYADYRLRSSPRSPVGC